MADGAVVEGAEIVEPVRIEEGVTVRGGRIGPNVTLEAGTAVRDSEIRDAVVGREATIIGSSVHDSIIGAHAHISDVAGSLLVTDHSVVKGGGA